MPPCTPFCPFLPAIIAGQRVHQPLQPPWAPPLPDPIHAFSHPLPSHRYPHVICTCRAGSPTSDLRDLPASRRVHLSARRIGWIGDSVDKASAVWVDGRGRLVAGELARLGQSLPAGPAHFQASFRRGSASSPAVEFAHMWLTQHEHAPASGVKHLGWLKAANLAAWERCLHRLKPAHFARGCIHILQINRRGNSPAVIAHVLGQLACLCASVSPSCHKGQRGSQACLTGGKVQPFGTCSRSELENEMRAVGISHSTGLGKRNRLAWGHSKQSV